MNPFIQFDLERWQGRWENTVTHNLAESGVEPLSVADLLELTHTDPADLATVRLGYSPTSGSDPLREAIAELYPGAGASNVLVTVGSAEANFNIAWTLSGPGKRVAVQTPVYKQIWGVARNAGSDVVEFNLDPDNGWALDTASAQRAITPDTGCVAVNNPSNPTGRILSEPERDLIVNLAREADAWLIVDEVYRGAELNGSTTPSWFGATDRTVVTGGLSKAFGLPGLRLGWVVAPESFIEATTQRHDYTVIGPAAMSDFLAQRVLAHRPALLERAQRILRHNHALLADWKAGLDGIVDWVEPSAGAIVFARYDLPHTSDHVAEFLRTEADTLVVPGSQFDREHFLRLGFGESVERLEPALDAAAAGLRKLAAG